MELGHLHPITGDPESGRFLGQPWRAAKVAGGVVAPTEQSGPSLVVETAECFQFAAVVTVESPFTSELRKRLWRLRAARGLDERA